MNYNTLPTNSRDNYYEVNIFNLYFFSFDDSAGYRNCQANGGQVISQVKMEANLLHK